MLRKTVNGQETRYWYKEDSSVPCAMRTPCGDEYRYEYDDANRLSIIASEFGERSFGYDSLDHIVSDTLRKMPARSSPVTGVMPMTAWTKTVRAFLMITMLMAAKSVPIIRTAAWSALSMMQRGISSRR